MILSAPVRKRTARALVAALLLSACGARSELIGPPLDSAARDASAPIDAQPACRSAAECDDAIPCTTDRCVIATGRCVHEGNDRLCDDGLFCTGVERCDSARGCTSTPVQCADTVACTQDTCDEERNQCVHAEDNAQCPVSYRCDATEGCLARAFAHGAQGLLEVLLPSVRVRVITPIRTSLTDIALHPDRTLYAIGAGGLYRLDEMTGATELVVGGEGRAFASLDAAPNGELYAAAGNELYRVDPQLRTITTIARFPEGLESSGDLALLEGRLFATARESMSTPDDWLVEIDRTASAPPRVVGRIGTGCVWGLAAFGPTLYGFSCMGQVLRIDPQTGRGSALALTQWRFYGATAR